MTRDLVETVPMGERGLGVRADRRPLRRWGRGGQGSETLGTCHCVARTVDGSDEGAPSEEREKREKREERERREMVLTCGVIAMWHRSMLAKLVQHNHRLYIINGFKS
jgi:hypothetical protein